MVLGQGDGTKIFKWSGSNFVEIKFIPKNSVTHIESLHINSNTYLAVSGYSSQNNEANIYKWDTNTLQFIEVDAIPTAAMSVLDIKGINLDGTIYLAVGNEESNYACDNTPSEIYKFCTIIDSDGDGVPDAEDKCPNRDATGYDADGDGCIDSLDGLEQLIEMLLDEGAIDKKLYKKLLKDDEKAIKSFEKDKICKTIKDLEKLIKDIDKQVDKKISNDDAALITDYSNNVIQWLLESLPEGDSCK